MVEKVVTTLSFIGGRLVQPGETVDVDADNPNLVLPAASTPVGSLSVDDLKALLRAKRRTAADSTNLADRSETNYGTTNVPIADIGPRSAGSTQPQGVPPGGHQVGSGFIGAAAADAPAATETYLAAGAVDPFDHDNDGKPGGSLTKAEIVSALKDRGDKVDESKSKADLAAQLANPPA